MNAKLLWWENPAITLDPFPHIPGKRILSFMPEELKPEWHAFLQGSQCLTLDDGDNGAYPWDFFRFVRLHHHRP